MNCRCVALQKRRRDSPEIFRLAAVAKMMRCFRKGAGRTAEVNFRPVGQICLMPEDISCMPPSVLAKRAGEGSEHRVLSAALQRTAVMPYVISYFPPSVLVTTTCNGIRPCQFELLTFVSHIDALRRSSSVSPILPVPVPRATSREGRKCGGRAWSPMRPHTMLSLMLRMRAM